MPPFIHLKEPPSPKGSASPARPAGGATGSAKAVALEGILELLPAGVIALDGKLRVRYINSAGLDALGITVEDLDTSEVLEGFLGQDSMVEALRAVIEGGEERRLAVFVPAGDDTPREIGLTVVPQRTEFPTASGIRALIIFRSLEDGRSLDERMREIEYQAATGRLAAGFAHEVRNPIAAIQGLAEGLLEELPTGSPLVEYAVRIRRLVDRLEGLVQSCLDLGGTAISLTSPIQPRFLVETALALTGVGDQVRVKIDPGAPRVLTDAPQTASCLKALILNAVEAGEPASEVEVRVRSGADDHQRVLFEVLDRGPGIPAHLMTRVFEPFFTTKPGSTGLGLAVARLVASRNHGSLEVRSRRGETVFALALPAAPLEEAAP
ncbi:MAG: ATP-binding protein [Acidobacteriota bacterium]